MKISQLSAPQVERLQRHLGLRGFGPAAQEKLLNARVTVVGAGGLGSAALPYLAAAGVGQITLVDDDVVDRTNLQRQVIHSEANLGMAKTQSAAQVLRGLNPDIALTLVNERLTSTNALEVLGGADVILDGTDNFTTRYVVADAAEILDIPVVWGAILRFFGQLSVFWPGKGPLYRDLYPSPPAPGEVPSCAEAGVLGVLPGVIGSLMATEAIKVLAHIGEPLIGQLLTYDALSVKFEKIPVRPDPSRVPVTSVGADVVDDVGNTCGAGSREGEVSAVQLRERIRGGEPMNLVDVREEWEWKMGHIPGAQLVPLSQLMEQPRLPGLKPGRPTYVYCRSGGRSARAIELVKGNHPNAQFINVTGGMQQWEQTEN